MPPKKLFRSPIFINQHIFKLSKSDLKVSLENCDYCFFRINMKILNLISYFETWIMFKICHATFLITVRNKLMNL